MRKAIKRKLRRTSIIIECFAGIIFLPYFTGRIITRILQMPGINENIPTIGIWCHGFVIIVLTILALLLLYVAFKGLVVAIKWVNEPIENDTD
ncbi:hypothetical protein KAS08_00445 [Candidatus Pacearchaeota archaeon]|nr:hypothetical protein [Candidatus Pacearchaeota archaeon]